MDPPPPAQAANPKTPAHPPFAEMITAAITGLNEQNGSSRRSISNYIEANFSNLPPNSSALLTEQLNLLKDNGQVLMVRNSYMLPRSGVVNGSASDLVASAEPKKRRGRPPKLKSVQPAVPVFVEEPEPELVNAAPQPNDDSSGQLGSMSATAEPASASGTGGKKRGRGRPPKQSGANHPPKASVVQPGVGRRRGRPKKNDVAVDATAAAPVVKLTRSRGRPRKLPNASEGGAAVEVTPDGSFPVAAGAIPPVAGKRRGRPPKAGGMAKKPRKVASEEPSKPRKLGGKPVGRPRKNEPAGAVTSDNHTLRAYLDLKGKLDYFQSTIKRAVSVLRPEMNTDTAVRAIQDLETLGAMNFNQPNVVSLPN